MMALENIQSFLLQKFDQTVVNAFITFCNGEHYEITNIEEDIEEDDNSEIFEHMQSKLQWNNYQTNTFMKALKNYFNPSTIQTIDINNNYDDTSSPSLTGIYSYDSIPPLELDRNEQNINNNSRNISPELQSIIDKLSNYYSQEIIKSFMYFCQEQEYKKTNILEDIEDNDNSEIYEHMQSKYNWNSSQCKSFIYKLNNILTGTDQTNNNNNNNTILKTQTFNHQSQNNKNYFQSSLSKLPKLPKFPNHHHKCNNPNCKYFNKSNNIQYKRNFMDSPSNAYRNKIHKLFGVHALVIEALFARELAIIQHYNNQNNNNNINKSYKPMKEAMNKHNYAMKNTNDSYIIKPASKNNNMNNKYSQSDFNLYSQESKSNYKSENIKIENTNPINQYSNIDVETRARISLRKKMKQEFENGTFYEKNKHVIPPYKKPPLKFMSEPINFNDDDFDDWNTVNDDILLEYNNNNKYNKNINNMVGLINIGATCYMNSVLQALNCSDMYRDFLLNKVNELKYDPKYAKKYKLPNQKDNDVRIQYSKQQRATIELKNILRNLYDKQERVISTKSFVKRLPKRWRPGKQQDSNEFAKFVLNCVWETIDQSSIMKNIYDSKLNNMFDETEIYQLKHLRLDPFSHGMLNYTTKCLNCKSKSAKFEAFFDLALALRNNNNNNNNNNKNNNKLSTKELIYNHMKEEYLSNDNTYFCNKCHKNVNAIRFISIVRPPKLLLICFKRYELNIETNIRQKLMLQVDCPLLLQIDRDICDQSNHEKVPYILYAVVVHHGSNAQFGHYYTIGRHSNDALKCFKNNINNKINNNYLNDGKELNDNDNNYNIIYNNLDGGNWYKFDDQRVTKSSYKQLNSLSYNDTPYMLFYVRVD